MGSAPSVEPSGPAGVRAGRLRRAPGRSTAAAPSEDPRGVPLARADAPSPRGAATSG